MSTKTLAVALLVVSAVGWVSISARQSRAVPGPGSGVATVTGTVTVENTPPLTPAGEWKVAIANAPEASEKNRPAWRVIVENQPAVSQVKPGFLQTGGQYTITWTDGVRERVTVAGVDTTGWVRVTSGATTKWVNLSTARSIEPM